jgi:hypothetical protein
MRLGFGQATVKMKRSESKLNLALHPLAARVQANVQQRQKHELVDAVK